MPTYTLIASNTLSSSAASVTFSSIPQTYTDLVLRMSARLDAGTVTAYVNFNSETPAGAQTTYSTIIIRGDGSAASSLIYSSESATRGFATVEANTDTANTFSSAEIYIPSYRASQNKPFSIYGVRENNATSATIGVNAALWRNTAAISSIVFTPASGNFVSGSSFFLYGIKNS